MAAAFIISLLLGVTQAVLLSLITGAVTSGNKRALILAFAVKFVLYAASIAVLMIFFLSFVVYCLCGYAAGLVVTAFIMFIFLAFLKRKK